MIDNIDSVRNDVEVSVIESMVKLIDKEFILMENGFTPLDEGYFFQEATITDDSSGNDANAKKKNSVLDEVRKKEKKDSNKLISIIMFIPRLVIAFCNSIANKFSKTDLGKKLKDAGEKLNNLSPAVKQSKVDKINKEFEGQLNCYIDEKSGKVKIKKDGSGFISSLLEIDETADAAINLFEDISNNFDPLNPSTTRSFIVKCDKIIKGDKTVKKSDVFEEGIGAVGETIDNCGKAAGILTKLGDKIKGQFQKMRASEMLKDSPDKDKEEALKNCEELTNKVTQIVSRTTNAASKISTPILRQFRRVCGLIKQNEALNEGYNDLNTDIIIKKFFENKDFEAENPKANGESDEAYKTRIDGIKRIAVQKLIDANEQADGSGNPVLSYAASVMNADGNPVGAIKEFQNKKTEEAREKARQEEKTIRK